MVQSNGMLNTLEGFTQVRFGFVQRRFSILITDVHLSSVSHQVLRKTDINVTPVVHNKLLFIVGVFSPVVWISCLSSSCTFFIYWIGHHMSHPICIFVCLLPPVPLPRAHPRIFSHPNVLPMLGACQSPPAPHPIIITHWMPYGSLYNVLHEGTSEYHINLHCTKDFQ